MIVTWGRVNKAISGIKSYPTRLFMPEIWKKLSPILSTLSTVQ